MREKEEGKDLRQTGKGGVSLLGGTIRLVDGPNGSLGQPNTKIGARSVQLGASTPHDSWNFRLEMDRGRAPPDIRHP